MKKKYTRRLVGTVLTFTMILQLCGQMKAVPEAAEESGTETGQTVEIAEIREEGISDTNDAVQTENVIVSPGDAEEAGGENDVLSDITGEGFELSEDISAGAEDDFGLQEDVMVDAGDDFGLQEDVTADAGDDFGLSGGTVTDAGDDFAPPEDTETENEMEQTESGQSDIIVIESVSDEQEMASFPQEEEVIWSLAVSDTEGREFQPVWVELPDSLECEGTELPLDCGYGVCLVTVPDGTEALKIGIGQEKSSSLFFSRWGGYLTENDGRWLLYPDFLEDDTTVYGASGLQAGQARVREADEQDGIYTLPLSPFFLYPEEFTLEQQAVYGMPEEQGEYAEICIGSFDEQGNRREHMVLLVQFEQSPELEVKSEEQQTVDETEEEQSEIQTGSEVTYGEIQTEAYSGEENTRETFTVEETVDSETELPEQSGQISDSETELPEQISAPETEQTDQLSDSGMEISVQAFEWEEDMLDTPAVYLAGETEISQVYDTAGDQLAEIAKEYIPQVSSTNGEWQVLGLARSGKSVDSSVYTGYKANVVSKLEETNGVLHAKKYTEYSRVILALTALGEDVTDVGGYNLLEPLADFDQTVWQGLNGAVFALIAFDCHNYEIPEAAEGKTQNSREKLIAYILEQEIPEGGWSMSGGEADPDMTAMTIQALAPYYQENQDVKAAVDRGLEKLSSMQTETGGFASYGTETSESCSQVIVALTALGIDPEKDSRFIKNGHSVLDALLSYAVPEGGFRHVAGQDADQMATEQAYYALTAYQRFAEGKTALYDMSDVPIKSDREKAAETQKLIAKIPDQVTLKNSEAVNLALASYNGLNSVQKSLLDTKDTEKLQQAVEEIGRLEIAQVEELISAIGTVTLKKEDKIVEANKAYHLLSSDQQKQVSNYSVLQKAQEKLEELKQTENSGQTNQTENSGQTNQTENSGQTNQTEKPGQTNQTEKPAQTENGSSTVKKPTGTTKVVNLVSSPSNNTTGTGSTSGVVGGTTGTSSGSGASANRTGTTAGTGTSGSSGTSSYQRVGGTAAGTASDSEPEFFSEGESPDAAETETAVPETALGAVQPEATKEARNVLQMMKKLPLSEQAEDDIQEEMDAFIECYLAYQSLTPGEKKYVEDSSVYGDYQNALERLGEKNHYDPVTGIDLRENPEESLPWYVCLAADPQLLTAEQEESILQVLGEDSEIFGINEIHFVSLLDGSDWKPDQLLKVRLPMADLGDHQSAVIVHIREDGSLEFLEGEINGNYLEFEASEFSEYGIAGIRGSLEDLLNEKKTVPLLPWAAGGGAAVLMLLLVLAGKRAIRKEGQR